MPVYIPNPTPGAGNPADLFEQLGAEMAARYAAAETTMIERLRRLAVQQIDAPAGAAERLAILTQLRLEGEAIAVALRDPVLVNQLAAIAAADGEAAAIARLGIADRIGVTSPITGTAANAIGSIALDLSNSLDDMSARITRWMPDAYRKVISMTAPSVILGVDTLLQSQRNAVEQFLARGVRGFTDKAGRDWRIGTYAEMATRTTVNRAWMDANIGAQQANGINLVSIVIGANSCNACAAHSGKIYSTDGTPGGTYILERAVGEGTVSVSVAGTLDHARASGWNHPNCRCVVVAYLPGLKIAEGSTYDRQGEADRDRLRALERRVRDLKRKQAASLDDVSAARYGRLVKRAQGDIRAHVKDTGLLRRNYREQLGFSDGRPPARPASPAPRPVLPPAPRALPPAAPRAITGTPIPPPAARIPSAPVASPNLGGALDAARMANGRAILAEAKTARDVGEGLKTALAGRDIRISGFETGINLDSAREFGEAALDMLERYPMVRLSSLEIGTGNGRGVLAAARGLYVNGRLDKAEIRGSKSYFADRAKYTASHEYATDQGHFHKNTTTAGRYTFIHEFGHAVDYMGQQRMRKEIRDIANALARENGIDPASRNISDVNAIRKMSSAYGNKKPGELIAEAFVDVEVNGDAALELSKRIHRRMIEIMNEEATR